MGNNRTVADDFRHEMRNRIIVRNSYGTGKWTAPAAWKRVMVLGVLVFCIIALQWNLRGQDWAPAAAESNNSEPAAALTAGILYLKFLDSRTGGGVEPDVIKVGEQPVKFQVESGSIVEMNLPDGNHLINVEAEGFQPMTFSAAVSGNEAPVMEIELDRVAEEEAKPVAENVAVLEGHVTDADTGELLQGVIVTLPDSRMTTTTGADGSYAFDLVVGSMDANQKPAVTMEVKSEGYQSLRMKNVALAAGERRRLPVRLTRLNTEAPGQDMIETDENAAEGHLRTSDWTFDVTIR